MGAKKPEPYRLTEIAQIELDLDEGITVVRYLKLLDEQSLDIYWQGVADACSALGIDFETKTESFERVMPVCFTTSGNTVH